MAAYNNGFAVNIRLPKSMYDYLKKESSITGLSMSHIVRDAIKGSERFGKQKPAGKKKG